jgi:hypothetical protein
LLFELLHVKLVSKVLNILILCAALLLLSLQLLEDLLTSGLGLGFLSLNFSLTALLLLSITTEHFVFVLLELALLSLELALLVN